MLSQNEFRPLILLVDDEEPIRRVSSAYLAGAGYRVLEASSGMEALQLAESDCPDLVVSDVLMPGMDGFEFVRDMLHYVEFHISEHIPNEYVTEERRRPTRKGPQISVREYFNRLVGGAVVGSSLIVVLRRKLSNCWFDSGRFTPMIFYLL